MLIITIPCFLEGGWIPDDNAGFGADQSPEFHIEGIDAKAESMVITLDDLGHPLQPGYNHWIAWNITPSACIPGGIAKGSIIENSDSYGTGHRLWQTLLSRTKASVQLES